MTDGGGPGPQSSSRLLSSLKGFQVCLLVGQTVRQIQVWTEDTETRIVFADGCRASKRPEAPVCASHFLFTSFAQILEQLLLITVTI